MYRWVLLDLCVKFLLNDACYLLNFCAQEPVRTFAFSTMVVNTFKSWGECKISSSGHHPHLCAGSTFRAGGRDLKLPTKTSRVLKTRLLLQDSGILVEGRGVNFVLMGAILSWWNPGLRVFVIGWKIVKQLHSAPFRGSYLCPPPTNLTWLDSCSHTFRCF